ncbi:hypothetical protein NKH77_06450 [Streptomyces sp. M19]
MADQHGAARPRRPALARGIHRRPVHGQRVRDDRPVTGGSLESDPPRPEGDYALTCLGRERVLTHAARTRGTPSP